MPEGHAFEDHNGKIRNRMRLKWWSVTDSSTYRSSAISIPNSMRLPNNILPLNSIENASFEKPVFLVTIGWKDGLKILNDNITCLDWSVVKSDGHLVAYRFDGEISLRNDKLVWC